jgi:membrane protease YdiL (CAAX protease family)
MAGLSSRKIEQKHSVNRNLWMFLALTFAWSWLFWMPEILWGIRLYVAPFGPTIAAIILTILTEGRKGIKELLKRGLSLKFRKIWLFPIFLLMPALTGLSLLIAIWAGEPVPEMPVLSQPLAIIPAFFYILFLGGPLAEEFGWRGYALDRLQASHSALVSSVLLGIIWGLWHVPLFFMEGQDIYRNVPIWAFILGTVLLSILFTWVYNNTGKSILAVLLFHTMGNLSHFIFPAMATAWGGLYSLLLNVVVVAVVLAVWGPKTMMRQRVTKAAFLPESARR